MSRGGGATREHLGAESNLLGERERRATLVLKVKETGCSVLAPLECLAIVKGK